MKRQREQSIWISLGFFLLGVLTRVPFCSRMLYHWDSVNFALGLEHYDVYLHQPHPPGYFLYVMLGRQVYSLLGDANASLVWLSVVATGLVAAVIFLLGELLWDRRAGIVASLLLLSSPLFWFHGEVALSYMMEAVFVILVALLCYRHLTGRDDRLWLSAITLGLAGGFRQNTLLFLLPLWAVAAWRYRWGKAIGAAVVLALTCLAWALPMLALTGGAARYWAALGAAGQGVAEESSLSDVRQIAVNGFRLTMFTAYALGVGLLVLLLGIGYRLWTRRRGWRPWASRPQAHLFFWWLAPNLLFYTIVHIRQPGHTFTFMPALLLLLSFVLTRMIPTTFRAFSGQRTWVPVGLVLLLNVTFFLAAPPYLFGARRIVFTTPSWATIRQRDRSLAERVAYIREHFAPATTALLSSGTDFRHPDYYLRDYQNQRFDSLLVSESVDLPDGVVDVVLFGSGLEGDEGSQRVLLSGGEWLCFLHRTSEQEVVIREGRVSLQPYPAALQGGSK